MKEYNDKKNCHSHYNNYYENLKNVSPMPCKKISPSLPYPPKKISKKMFPTPPGIVVDSTIKNSFISLYRVEFCQGVFFNLCLFNTLPTK